MDILKEIKIKQTQIDKLKQLKEFVEEQEQILVDRQNTLILDAMNNYDYTEADIDKVLGVIDQ